MYTNAETLNQILVLQKSYQNTDIFHHKSLKGTNSKLYVYCMSFLAAVWRNILNCGCVREEPNKVPRWGTFAHLDWFFFSYFFVKTPSFGCCTNASYTSACCSFACYREACCSDVWVTYISAQSSLSLTPHNLVTWNGMFVVGHVSKAVFTLQFNHNWIIMELQLETSHERVMTKMQRFLTLFQFLLTFLQYWTEA